MKFNEILNRYEPRHFYLIGTIVFSIVLICSIISLIYFWNISFIVGKISSIAYLVFDIGLLLLFRKLFIDEFEKKKLETISEEELDRIIDKLK